MTPVNDLLLHKISLRQMKNGHRDNQYNNTQHKNTAMMLSVIFFYCYDVCNYDTQLSNTMQLYSVSSFIYCYVECHYAECHHARITSIVTFLT